MRSDATVLRRHLARLLEPAQGRTAGIYPQGVPVHRHTRIEGLYPPGCWYCRRGATERCELTGRPLCYVHADQHLRD